MKKLILHTVYETVPPVGTQPVLLFPSLKITSAMYQPIKDVYEAIDRGLKTERQILQSQNAVGGGGETRQITYTKGRISGLEQALGLLNLVLDQYETEP